MELRDVFGIVRRHWIVALVGLVLALGLGVATYAARGKQKYSSTATLFVTQGRSAIASAGNATGNPTDLAGFAYLYAQIAQSDLIRNSIGAPPDSIGASVVTSASFGTGTPLPFLNISGQAYTAEGARLRAEAAAAALRSYVRKGEVTAGTPVGSRINLEEISAAYPGAPEAARTRVVILPLVVVITVLLLTLGLIFLIENVTRPRSVQDVGPHADARDVQTDEPVRRRSNWMQGGSGRAEQGSTRGGFGHSS